MCYSLEQRRWTAGTSDCPPLVALDTSAHKDEMNDARSCQLPRSSFLTSIFLCAYSSCYYRHFCRLEATGTRAIPRHKYPTTITTPGGRPKSNISDFPKHLLDNLLAVCKTVAIICQKLPIIRLPLNDDIAAQESVYGGSSIP